MHNVTVGGKWARCMRELSVLFLTTVCELTIISIKIATVKTKNFIVVPRPSECSLNPSIQRMVPFLPARLPDAFSPLFQRPYLLFSKTAVSRPRAFTHTTPLPSQSTPHTEPARSRCSINARGTGASPLSFISSLGVSWAVASPSDRQEG